MRFLLNRNKIIILIVDEIVIKRILMLVGIIVSIVFVLLLIRLLFRLLFFILRKFFYIRRAKRIKYIREHRENGKIKILPKQELSPEQIQEKVVGFAKPVGFWSSLILGDEITKTFNMATQYKDKNNGDFWESVAEATARKKLK